MKLYYMSSKENVIRLYNKYKSSGGFGAYSLDMLTGTGIHSSNVQGLLQQELLMIELHNITHETPVTQNELENKYLGRGRVSADSRSTIKLSKYRLPPEYDVRRSKDPYALFMKTNSIRGFMNRAYWNEREQMKKELL